MEVQQHKLTQEDKTTARPTNAQGEPARLFEVHSKVSLSDEILMLTSLESSHPSELHPARVRGHGVRLVLGVRKS